MRRIPFDPPWLLVLVLAGTVLAMYSVSSWPIPVTWAVIGVTAATGAIGIDRWYERYRPRRPDGTR